MPYFRVKKDGSLKVLLSYQKNEAQKKYVLEKEEIKDIFHEHKGRYGYRRITAEMRNRNYVINHKTVQRLMGEMGLKCKIRKVRYHSYRGEIGKVAPMLLPAILLQHLQIVNGLQI